MRRHRSVHAIWSELTASLLPIRKGLLLGIKIPLGEKVPGLITKRPSQPIPAIHGLRRKDLRHSESRLPLRRFVRLSNYCPRVATTAFGCFRLLRPKNHHIVAKVPQRSLSSFRAAATRKADQLPLQPLDILKPRWSHGASVKSCSTPKYRSVV